VNAIDVLKRATDSYAPCFQENGEICDPVFGEPFQYGTPYHALCNAVLALKLEGSRRDRYRRKAVKGLESSLNHVVRYDLPLPLSSIDRDTGVTTRINHRDFFWPPVLKTYLILKALGEDTKRFEEGIRAVDIERSFRSRPPSNWAMVWLLGEWSRIREGLSPFDTQRFDEWLAVFFRNHIDVGKGFYHEPGHPNSYDLFTRFHLACILREGYDGRFREAMERLMATGLRRSLAVQLSDGSLASAYRSTGMTWTLGVQCAYFTHAARFFAARDEELSQAAWQAARRALGALARWQRKGGYYSPAENCLPGSYRVGYERYTTDANHGTLPMGALAVAILNGFDAEPLPSDAPRAPLVWIEHDPVYRALAHRGPYSAHFNAFPSPKYDGYGLVDLTFGPNRYLHFASSVKSMHSGGFLNLGMAYKDEQVDGELTIVARRDYALSNGFRALKGPGYVGFSLEGRCKGEWHTYAASIRLDDDGVVIEEDTRGLANYKSLLIPYLRDGGRGVITEVALEAGIRLIHGGEEIAIEPEQEIHRVIHLPYGYENRRGLCGLVRVDFKGPRERISYRVRRVK